MTSQDGLEEGAELAALAQGSELRRLPWAAPASYEAPYGKACFLVTDDPSGLLSQMADNAEQWIIQDGRDVREAATVLLDTPLGDVPRDDELRGALSMAVQALSNVIRVAQCRGERLNLDCEPEVEEEGV
ncbi:hypothetical protein [Streptomyces phytohabitans]|uniref:hypothetical protein n=1 Tax=Streptomyces phytohabitans TaxID=1150371 RepID=UPI00345BF6EC